MIPTFLEPLNLNKVHTVVESFVESEMKLIQTY